MNIRSIVISVSILFGLITEEEASVVVPLSLPLLLLLLLLLPPPSSPLLPWVTLTQHDDNDGPSIGTASVAASRGIEKLQTPMDATQCTPRSPRAPFTARVSTVQDHGARSDRRISIRHVDRLARSHALLLVPSPQRPVVSTGYVRRSDAGRCNLIPWDDTRSVTPVLRTSMTRERSSPVLHAISRALADVSPSSSRRAATSPEAYAHSPTLTVRC